MKSNQITIKDIARTLGISASTVSRALKDHPDISKATKDQVNKLAHELNYRPNPIALSLKSRRSNVIGVIIPEIVHYFFSSVISGIEKVASEHGYSVMVSQSNENFEKEIELTDTFINSIIDGLLISISKETDDYSHLNLFRDEEIPVVCFDRMIEEFACDRVIINDFDGAYKATEHLIIEGRRRIVHFAGPQTRLIGRNRKDGYIQALKNNGVPVDESLIIPCDDFDKAIIETTKLVESGAKFDAIFTANDFTAAGALKVLKMRGFYVPRDISVVGFGDDYISKMTDPALTSVQQPGFEMGQKAMEMLIHRINNPKSTDFKTEILPTSLVKRDSSRGK